MSPPINVQRLIFRLLPAIISVGCSSGNDSKSTPVDWTVGRGTAACHEWQKAFCERQSTCGGVDLVTCANQLQTVTCASDATAANCATSITAATCSTATSGCNISDVADTAWAIQSCTDYLTAACTHDANCGSGIAVDTCVANLQSSSSCAGALGVKLKYESCLAQINAATCTTTLPADCKSLIYIGS